MRFDHIEIDGSPAFAQATVQALALLKNTPSWRYMSGIGRIRELQISTDASGGYLFGNEINVGRVYWQGDAKTYAGMLTHEAAHHTDGNRFGAEGETVAFTAQAQALRELGASWGEVSACEKQARNPQHHQAWADEWARQTGGSPETAQAATPQHETRRMGSIERMARRYHGV